MSGSENSPKNSPHRPIRRRSIHDISTRGLTDSVNDFRKKEEQQNVTNSEIEQQNVTNSEIEQQNCSSTESDERSEEEMLDGEINEEDTHESSRKDEESNCKNRTSLPRTENKTSAELKVIVVKKGEKDTTSTNSMFMKLFFFLTILGVGVAFFGMNSITTKETTLNIETVRSNYNNQEEYLWHSFSAGVKELLASRRQATSFILLYKEEATSTLNSLIEELSHYAVCHLSSCSSVPMNVMGSDLNTPDFIRDYGNMLVKYKPKLEESHVMIVRDLDKIPGVVAPAFHAFCDELNPVVRRTLFIFTVKIEESHKNGFKFLETYLQNVWSPMGVTTFYPLFTRIGDMIFEIYPEEEFE